MTCGAVKTSACGAIALTCNLDPGHALPHGVREHPELPPYVRWPVAWTDVDEQLHVERHGWRKPHVRRAYQTLGMWKAKQR